MNWEELRKEKTFCILPFIHSATLTDGNTPLCCVAESNSGMNLNSSTLKDYWNSNYVQEIRKKMLSGESVKDCSRCYEEEKSGYRSHRIIENKAWEEKLGSSELNKIFSKVKNDGSTSQGVISADLRLGNTCNLQCVMCQPRDSSKWKGASSALMNELSDKKLSSEWREKNNIKVEMYEWYKNESFWQDLKSFLPTLRELIIGGGEPMLIKEHLDFIKSCAESGEAQHIHLRYHTNMTVFPEEMIPFWEKFERVEFFTSIDGIGEVGNYVRYPAQWSVVEKNLRRVDQMGDNIWLRLLYSVHAMNVHHFPQFLDWAKETNFKKAKQFPHMQGFVHPGIVHWPDYLNVKVLPSAYKEYVTKMWEKSVADLNGEPCDKYEGVLQFMHSEDWSERLPMTRDYIRALDKTRKTDSYSVLPELSEHLLDSL